MRRATLVAADDGAPLSIACELAVRPWTRMRGLLGRRSLPPAHGMLFNRTSSVHTFFMRFPIDVVFLDAELEVKQVASSVAPWKTASCRGARQTLELAAGEADRLGLAPGRRLATAGE